MSLLQIGVRRLALNSLKPLQQLKRILTKQGRPLNERSLVAYFNPDSMISEQIRNLRTNTLFLSKEYKSRSILLTSPANGEGKSTILANLAISLVQNKERVLLIDANLRNPSQHVLFDISNKKGLSQVLTGEVPLEETIFQTGIGLLDLIPSGPIPFNPTELISSERMIDLMAAVPQYYNHVLIDSPAADITDTKLLANLSDGVVLVLNRGKTAMAKAIEAKKMMEFAKAKVIGAVFNEK